MALTNAQKQAFYRERHLKEGERKRLQVVVSLHTKRALERLSRHLGLTQASTLDQIIGDAQEAILSGLSSEEQAHYDRD